MIDLNRHKKKFQNRGMELLSGTRTGNKTVFIYKCANGHINHISDSSLNRGAGCSLCSPNKKFTDSFIRSEFKKRGFDVIDDFFPNINTPMKLQCQKGHVISMSFDRCKRGGQCPICRKEKKLQEIQQYFQSLGCVLLSTEYINLNTPLEYLCPNKHKNIKRLAYVKLEHICSLCTKRKTTPFDVRQKFLNKGLIPLFQDNDYINSKTPLQYKCQHGHEGTMTLGQVLNRTGCPMCVKPLKLSFDFVKSTFTKRGYTMLDVEYKNTQHPIKYICPNGHSGAISFASFQRGSVCRACTTSMKHTIEEARVAFDRVGLILLDTEYKNIKTKMMYRCNRQHVSATTLSRVLRGQGCSICKESSGEKLVASFLTNHNIAFKRQQRFYDCRYKNPLPFDFFLTDLNILVEYDGIQHFINCTRFNNSLMYIQNNDAIKNQYCFNRGIKLVRICYKDKEHIEDILMRELSGAVTTSAFDLENVFETYQGATHELV